MSDKVQGGTRPQTTDITIMTNINCITFNHVNYIRTALDSFLMQKTDFAFEMLIHDDASMGGTSDTIREYMTRYPEEVKLLIQAENQYSRGIGNTNGALNSPRARGEYIFMCDGDDYFLSPDRLRKQVDYTEAHPDCTLRIHSANVNLVGKALIEGQMGPYRKSRVLSPEEIIDKPLGYTMSSMVFSTRLAGDLPDHYVNCPVGDTPIQLIVAADGYGYYLGETMSAYRVGVAGSWIVRGKNGDYQGRQRVYCGHVRYTHKRFDRATGGGFKEAAESAARRIYYQAVVSTKRFEEMFSPQYRRYYKELTPRIRFFLRFEHIMPAIYEMMGGVLTGK